MKEILFRIDGSEQKIHLHGGRVSLTRKHYLEGDSLQWQYRAEDAFEVRTKVISRQREAVSVSYLNGKKSVCSEYPFGINCWIYSETANGNVLKFEFGTDGKENLSFEYCLNFVGWKEISLTYERGFMKGKYSDKMNYFRVTALQGAGTVYFSEVQLCKSVCPNHLYGKMAPQVKHLPQNTRRGPLPDYDISRNRPVFLTEDVNEKICRAFQNITKKYFELMDEIDLPPFCRGNIPYDEAVEVYSKHHIEYRDGVVTGKRITQTSLYAKAMKSIAARFYGSGDEKDADCFVLMWRHLHDQNTAINWYHGRGVGSAMLMMREELKRRGILEEAIAYLKQAYNFSRIYDTTSSGAITYARFEDTDTIGMDLPGTLVCILLMENTPEKVRDMRHFVYYIENFCLAYAPGLASGYKSDGSAFHHCGFVRQYETVANYSMSRVLYMLSDSVFMISEEAAQRFVNTLETTFLMYNGVYEPFVTSAYAFDAMRDTSVVEFAHAARALHNTRLAQMYVTLAQSSEKEQQNPNYQMFLERGIEPITEVTRHKTLTYAAAAYHKRKNWTAAVRGHSKYVYPMEVWPDAGAGSRYTAFSLFRSFGFLEILYPPEAEGGTNNGLHITEGFDYRRWPGSTAVHVPLSKIKTVPLMIEDEWAEWLLSDRAFVGGLDTKEQNGVFAMQLHGPEKYGLESFQATKTYHFYDDMIVCLGSGISDDISAYRTETTMFQDFGTGAVRNGNILLDNRNNGYWVFDGAENIRFIEKECRSRDVKDSEDTNGLRTFGVIDHGKMPRDAKYGYLLKIGTTRAEMERREFAPYVQVLRQDETAHIVRLFHRTDYVFFCKNYETEDEWIGGVSGSCIVSVEEKDGEISLAVCDPDMRFYLGESEDYDLNRHKEEKSIYGRFWIHQESMPSRIWVIVNRETEQFEIVNGNAKIVQKGQGKTVFEFLCREGMTNEIVFQTEQCRK